MKKRVKKRIKWSRVFLALFLFISIFLMIWFVCAQHFQTNLVGETTQEDNVDQEEQKKETEYSLTLAMVGDSLIHDKIYQEALAYGNGEYYDFKPMLEMIKPITEKYDVAYYNQETILGGSEIGLSSYPAFNSPYEVGDAMIDAGFNLVSLATNHTLDRGKSAIVNSRNYWNSKNDVLAVGSYLSDEERNEIHVVEKNHITYTMLNYTYGTNGIAVPSGQEYFVNVWPVTGNDPSTDVLYQEYKGQVKKDIEAVRDKVDVLLVAMHWGVEYQTSPNAYQKDMASFLAGLGVDIIIGTHPHVIQPIEWIDDTLVIYSLGNFISAHEVIDMGNRVGLMSSMTITKKIYDDEVEVSINNLENELLYTYYTDDYQDIKVIPFSRMNDMYLSNYEMVYEKYKQIVLNLDSSIYVVPLN